MPPQSASIDAAVDALMQQGFSRLAAAQLAAEAMEEVKAKKRAVATTKSILATPYREWLRQASPEYIWDKPVHKVLCDNIDDIIAGRTRRLCIFMPPRVGKSSAVTERLPVYWQEAHPGSRVIVGAYNRDLAKLFTYNSLRLYRSRNPDMIESEAQEEWTTKAGGSVLAAGVGSGVTGRGADCLVAGTLIRTSSGLLPIEQIVSMTNRPEVLAYDHAAQQLAWAPVLATRETSAGALVEVVTEGGRRLTCTPDHRICVSGWDYEPARLLVAGDRLRVVDSGAATRDRVLEMRPVDMLGSRPVYDLQTRFHNFYADDLLVHNCLIIDDPVRGYEEAVSAAYQNRVWQWWQNDIRTRVNDIAKTPVVLILTRWHEMDLAGRILEQDKRKLWKVISFPALAPENDLLGRKPGESIWPERLPAEELEEIKAEMGVRFDALYQQDPTPAEGGLIEEGWFWKSTVEGKTIVSEVRAWDLAATATSRKNGNPDWTAGCRMTLIQGDGKLIYAIRDCTRIRAEPGARDTFIQSVALADGPEVLQLFEENDDGDKSVTHALRQALTPHGIGVEGVKPKNDKVVRSTNARSSLQRGEMFMCDGRWNYDFVNELVRFPNGRHDDQVDAWSTAYNHLVIRAIKVSIR